MKNSLLFIDGKIDLTNLDINKCKFKCPKPTNKEWAYKKLMFDLKIEILVF